MFSRATIAITEYFIREAYAKKWLGKEHLLKRKPLFIFIFYRNFNNIPSHSHSNR